MATCRDSPALKEQTRADVFSSGKCRSLKNNFDMLKKLWPLIDGFQNNRAATRMSVNAYFVGCREVFKRLSKNARVVLNGAF